MHFDDVGNFEKLKNRGIFGQNQDIALLWGAKKVVYFKRYYRVTTWDLKLLVLYKSHFHCVISVRIRSVSGPNAGKYGPEKLQTQTIFPQCLSFATLHVWNTTFQYFVLLGKFLLKTMQKSCSIESSKSDFM